MIREKSRLMRQNYNAEKIIYDKNDKENEWLWQNDKV